MARRGPGIRQARASSPGTGDPTVQSGRRSGRKERSGARPRARTDARFHARSGPAMDAPAGRWRGSLRVAAAELPAPSLSRLGNERQLTVLGVDRWDAAESASSSPCRPWYPAPFSLWLLRESGLPRALLLPF